MPEARLAQLLQTMWSPGRLRRGAPGSPQRPTPTTRPINATNSAIPDRILMPDVRTVCARPCKIRIHESGQGVTAITTQVQPRTRETAGSPGSSKAAEHQKALHLSRSRRPVNASASSAARAPQGLARDEREAGVQRTGVACGLLSRWRHAVQHREPEFRPAKKGAPCP